MAKSIATETEQATGKHCEVFSNETGSVIICNHTVTIAVRTIDDIREIANALDTATSHVLNAAPNR